MMEGKRKITTEVKIVPKISDKIGQLIILLVAGVILGSVFLAAIIISSIELTNL